MIKRGIEEVTIFLNEKGNEQVRRSISPNKMI
jgi:hypothetical protein